MKFKAVIFDCDGVIVNTDIKHSLAWQETFKKHEIIISEEDTNLIRGLRRADAARKILEYHHQPINDDILAKLCFEKNELYLKYISTLSAEEILPGILELIEFLQDNGYKLGLASVSQNSLFILKKLALEKYFDYIADPSEIKKAKPDPEIFYITAKKLDIKPWECIGIEDSQAGIDAINAALMRSIAIDYHSELKNYALRVKSPAHLTPAVFTRFINSL